jgi:adenylate cyclase
MLPDRAPAPASAADPAAIDLGGSSWRRLRAFLRDLYCLPLRVQALVDAELQRADILGAWLGVALAVFLGGLYVVAPKALDIMGGVKPVPIVVGLFLLSSVWRLRLAYRGPLSSTKQTLFIVADIGLLYALIWSYHLQYSQPAAFYLKAPTFLFVFLLIAIRALRFEPVSILISGFFAALGWAVMTVYALMNTPPPAATRDFIAYMTGNRVLIGAEVEKIVAILLVSIVLTLAIMAGRRQLVLAVTGSVAKDDLSRFFAPEVAARITSDDELLRPGYGEIRRGAILVTDIRGFTSLAARHQPRQVMELLVEYQRRMSHVIGEHGGAIDKFLGDGILATFGCTKSSTTPAAEAMRALMSLIREAEVFARSSETMIGERMRVGFAVASGDVLCGTVGDASRLEFTVIGDAVNRAVKLEKTNKTLGTVAVVEASALETARREGFQPVSGLASQAFAVDPAGAGERCEVIGWFDPKGAAA